MDGMMVNPFDTDAFQVVELTKAINILPNNYGRLRELNVFPVKGVRSRTVVVEEKSGILNLLPTLPVGAPGTMATQGKRQVRSITIPHIPHEDVILASEYEGIRAFGTESELETLASVMNDHLQTMRNKHSITWEHLRMGALKGIILDADGSIIENLYDLFGIDPKVIYFDLENKDTKVRQKCMAVKRWMEDNLQGEVMTGVRALCSETFFDDLTEHPDVAEVFKYQQSQMLHRDLRTGFEYGGIIFEEYRGRADDMDGNSRLFIEEGDAHFYPEGTMSTFDFLCAPADFMETVNTKGLELYAKQEARKYNRGVDVHTQSNPLPFCYRPKLLVRGTVEGAPAPSGE